MTTLTVVPRLEHDLLLSLQVNELMNCSLDSALKLSLLSESWLLSRHDNGGGSVTDFALRLGYSENLVLAELEQLVQTGYLNASTCEDGTAVYLLTADAPRLAFIRRMLSSWRDLRFHLRANALLTFAPTVYNTPPA